MFLNQIVADITQECRIYFHLTKKSAYSSTFLRPQLSVGLDPYKVMWEKYPFLFKRFKWNSTPTVQFLVAINCYATSNMHTTIYDFYVSAIIPDYTQLKGFLLVSDSK